MMKSLKCLALIVAAVMVISLTACGDNGTETGSGQTSGPAVSESDTETGGAFTESEGTGESTAESGDASSEGETESSDAQEEFTEVNDIIFALDRLNVRSAPDTESEILGTLQPGEAVPRVGIGENWMKIVYQGKKAYVAAAYVSETKPAGEESTEAESSGADSTETTQEDVTVQESTRAPETSEGVGIYYDNGGYLVAIDAGHQIKGNNDLEPIGPGAAEMKPKVSSGTQGIVTGIAEHEMNLVISLYLRDELLARGYSVLMIRETAEVDISNAERALLANSYNADAFVRIHGNGVDRQDPKGALTMCMSPDNPYNGELYSLSYKLSKLITDGMCEATGAVNRGVLETDTMSGINWCEIPVSIVEVGFMSNPEEDRAMAEDSYRRALAKGIADGIDAYFGR